jgi:hypothetical protein
MGATEQFRAKATDFAELAKMASNSNEKRDLQDLVRSFNVLADNEQWLADNHDKTVHPSEHTVHPSQHHEPHELALTAQETCMLKCLGAALLMRWHTLPGKLQREIVADADALGDLFESAASSGAHSPC